MCEVLDKVENRGIQKGIQKGAEGERKKNEIENLRKAKALVKAGTSKEVVAKIMGVNIDLL